MGGSRCDKLQVLEMTEENGLSWSCKAELPAWRWDAASVVYDGKLWVMGGADIDDDHLPATDSVIIYDPEGDSWATGPALPLAVVGSAVEHDGDLHLKSGNGAHTYRGGVWVEVAGAPRCMFPAVGSLPLG